MRWPLIFIRFSGKKVAPKIIIFDHLLTFTEKLYYKWQNLKVLFFTKKMLLPLNSFLLFGARRDNNDHNSTIVKSLTMQCSLAQCNIFPKINLISRKHGISLSKLFWPTVKKNWSSDQEKLLNSSQKAENLQIVWNHQSNLFKQLKVRTIFGNRMLF